MFRRLLAVLAASVIAVFSLVGLAGPAHAASDSFDRFDVDYTIRPDGTVHVQETVTLRFGSGSGRRGLERFLVVREPWDDQQDAVYRISNVSVTSPDPVSTRTSTGTYRGGSPREEVLRIRIGTPDRTISAPTATYVIEYDVAGAMRSPENTLQFYWDVTGSEMGPIRSSTVRVQAPADIVDATCFVGPPARSSNQPCGEASQAGNTATFAQPDGIPAGSLFTVATQLPQGATAQTTPILVESGAVAAQREREEQQRNDRVLQGVGAGAALGVPVLGWLWYRRNGHDERYVGVPPGTVPVEGQPVRVERNDPTLEIPVAFSPPKLPLTYAGYLLDGHYKTEHMTATLVGLATHGAIQLTSDESPRAVLRDPQAAPDDPSRILLNELFDEPPATDPLAALLAGRGGRGMRLGGGFQARSLNHVFGPGGFMQAAGGGQSVTAGGTPARREVELQSATQLAHASDLLAADAHDVAVGNQWFKRVARGRKTVSITSLIWVFFIGSWLVNGPLLASLFWVLVPVTIALVITLLVVSSKMARGQRTAAGRAWTDQVEGFRTYIATAEADQLRFEEGEDIFSKYLPWAVLFGLADRWVTVCQEAVALGRLRQPDASWYGGSAWDAHFILWNLNSLNGSIGSATAPSVAASGPSFSNDIGFGGGSAFGGGGFGGGGGFAGGGGGGGGGGSW